MSVTLPTLRYSFPSPFLTNSYPFITTQSRHQSFSSLPRLPRTELPFLWTPSPSFLRHFLMCPACPGRLLAPPGQAQCLVPSKWPKPTSKMGDRLKEDKLTVWSEREYHCLGGHSAPFWKGTLEYCHTVTLEVLIRAVKRGQCLQKGFFFFFGCCCFVFSTPRYKLSSLATCWRLLPPIYQTSVWQEKKGNIMSNKINVGVKGDFYLL